MGERLLQDPDNDSNYINYDNLDQPEEPINHDTAELEAPELNLKSEQLIVKTLVRGTTNKNLVQFALIANRLQE